LKPAALTKTHVSGIRDFQLRKEREGWGTRAVLLFRKIHRLFLGDATAETEM